MKINTKLFIASLILTSNIAFGANCHTYQTGVYDKNGNQVQQDNGVYNYTTNQWSVSGCDQAAILDCTQRVTNIYQSNFRSCSIAYKYRDSNNEAWYVMNAVIDKI